MDVTYLNIIHFGVFNSKIILFLRDIKRRIMYDLNDYRIVFNNIWNVYLYIFGFL